MRFIPVGADALLVEVGDVREAMAVFARARGNGIQAVDIVPAARTVLFDGVRDVPALVDEVGSWTPSSRGAEQSKGSGRGVRRVDVPTVYDGEDLGVVARMWDMTVAEVVATHTGSEMTVAFCGFAPGFAYCTGLPAGLEVARRDSPRPTVPAGSVGLAGEFTGVYPQASPGGWQLIGRTDLLLWNVGRADPATLSPGTVVTFVEVER